MTRARMDWKQMTLEFEGHACFAEAGRDIVCAGISILTQSLVNALADLETQYGMARSEQTNDQEKAILKIRSRVCWANVSVIRAYFEVAVTGLRMLAKEYPEYITLEEVK